MTGTGEAFETLAAALAAAGSVDGADVERIGALAGDVEAETLVPALFAIDRACEETAGEAWTEFFLSAVADATAVATGAGPEAGAALELLETEIGKERPPRPRSLDLLVRVAEAADAPETPFQDLLHSAFLETHSLYRRLGPDDVARIDRAVGWSRNQDIKRSDADFLFRINDVLDKPGTDPAWRTLFVEAITGHLLNDPFSPGQVDFSEAEWLIRCIEGDGSLDANEQALLDHLDSVSPKGQNLGDLVASVSELMKAQEDTYLKTIQALVRALEAKDRYTAQHSSRVAYYAQKLGERIGLSDKMLRKLRYGSIMHDLGKIGVPDGILNKPAALDDDEYHRIKRHPVDTVKIMKPLEDLKDFMDIAFSHHERWDGTGYPDGLAGTEIPLLSRIVAVADTWDAMVGDRIYRKAIPREKALDILETERDLGQWDPELLDAFIGLVREGLDPDGADLD